MKLNYGLLSPAQNSGGQRGTRGTTSISATLRVPLTVPCTGDSGGQTGQSEGGEKYCPLPSPTSPKVGGHEKPGISAPSPLSPVVPSENDEISSDREVFEERAAIMQYEGELSRAEAEQEAMKAAVLSKVTP